MAEHPHSVVSPKDPRPWHRRMGTQILDGLEERFARTAPPNFHWAITWFVTEVCNLRCKYCFVDFEKQHPPMEPQMDALLKARPKYLMTVGGEPLLVPWLPEALAILRREVNPWLVLTTNALVPKERIAAVVPLVNCFVVSLDGLGENNRVNRGVDGSKVLAGLRHAREVICAEGLATELSINVVVTRDSFRGIPELYREIRRIGPEIGLCFNPATPYDSPLSIASDPALYQEYLDLVRDISKDPRTDFCGPGRSDYYQIQSEGGVDKAGQAGAKPTPDTLSAAALPRKTWSGHNHVSCMRQFVWSNVWSDGRHEYCHPHLFSEMFRKDLVRSWEAKRYGLAFYTGMLFLNKMLRRANSTDCYHPCNCLPFLDDILNATDGAPVPGWTSWFRGRFTPEEVDACDGYLRAHFGRGLAAGVKAVFLDRGSEDGPRDGGSGTLP